MSGGNNCKVKEINFERLTAMYSNGIVFLGCGGDLNEWKTGILEELSEKKLIEIDKYDDEDWLLLKTSEGRKDLFFNIFKKGTKGNLGKLAMWKITFGDCSWFSDYKNNYSKDFE